MVLPKIICRPSLTSRGIVKNTWYHKTMMALYISVGIIKHSKTPSFNGILKVSMQRFKILCSMKHQLLLVIS